MKLYAPHESLSVCQPFPGVEVLDIGGKLKPQEFTEFVSTLNVPPHVDPTGNPVPGRQARLFDRQLVAASRTPETPRDPWAPDHFWHFDGGYSGAKNQFASVLYMQRLEGDKTADTSLIDTAVLLQCIEREHPGITEELTAYSGLFSVVRYFATLLPQHGSEAAKARTLADKNAATLGDVAVKEGARFPAKTFPAAPVHPFRGMRCTTIDQLNMLRLKGTTNVRSREIISLVRDEYLNLPAEELAERPYYHRHDWSEGEVLIFPQIGTLHRAEASPKEETRRDTLRLFIV